MKNKRILFAAVCLLNLAAVVCLVYFAVPLLARDTFMPNPDAMIPMTRWEGCGTILMLGLLPMAAANALMCLTVAKGKRRLIRASCFLPLIAELALVALYLIVSFI